MRPSLSPADIESRLREASHLSDLAAGKRLEAKIDLSPEAVRARLVEASNLLDTCRALGAFAASRRRT